MRFSRLILLVVVALSVLAGCDILNLTFIASAEERAVADLVNEHRADMGLAELEWSRRVYLVADSHSEDMNDRDFFSHTNPDGDGVGERLDAAGVSYSSAGENIAYGYTTPEAVVTGWLNSAGHKANIENAGFTHHGIGYVADGNYWTHVFIGQ